MVSPFTEGIGNRTCDLWGGTNFCSLHHMKKCWVGPLSEIPVAGGIENRFQEFLLRNKRLLAFPNDILSKYQLSRLGMIKFHFWIWFPCIACSRSHGLLAHRLKWDKSWIVWRIWHMYIWGWRACDERTLKIRKLGPMMESLRTNEMRERQYEKE